MFSQTLCILFASALLLHGVGHIRGFWMPISSRLRPNGSKFLARIVSNIFWLLSAVGFVAAMLGFLDVVIPFNWWQPCAIGAVCISMIGLFLFGKNWALLNSMGAFTMNLSIITVVVIQMMN
jgi:hypothetical protein